MQKIIRLAVLAAFMGALTLGGAFTATAANTSSAAKLSAVGVPTLTMKHWVHSTKQEKLSFLFGFTTLLELEKEWQSPKALPLEQSTIGTWVRGLDGVTLGHVMKSLDKYALDNPGDRDRPVLEVIGATYVRPKLTPKELDRAAKKIDRLSK